MRDEGRGTFPQVSPQLVFTDSYVYYHYFVVHQNMDGWNNVNVHKVKSI